MGENHIRSALAAILFSVFPFLVMGLMPLMVKTERVGIRSLIGAVVGFGGVVMIFAEPVQIGSGALIGMIFLILSPICAAIGSVSVKAYFHDEPVFPMITLQMTVGAILLTLTALVFEPFSDFKFTTTSVGAIVFLASFGSIITFGSYYWLLKRVRLVTMSMIALITPVVAMFMGYIFLKEELTVGNYIGAALVLMGVAIVNIKQTHEIDVA
jgi:drug/metabolite transporter (DMT)-like permease